MKTMAGERQIQFWWQHPAVIACVAISVSLIYGVALAYDMSTLLLLVAPIALILGIVALIKTEYAAVALLVVEWGFISDIAVKYHGLPSISKPLVVVLFGILLIRRFTGRRQPFVYDGIIWWMLAYLFVASLGLLYARYNNAPMPLVIDLGKQVLMFIVLINLIVTKRSFEATMWLLLALGALLGALTVYQELTQSYGSNFGGLARMTIAQIVSGESDRPRASGTTGEPNAYGQQLLVLVPIGLWAMLQGRSVVSRTAGAVMTVACLAGLGLSFSRSTYLALFVVLGLFALHIRLNPRYLLVLIPLVGVLLWAAPDAVTARFSTFSILLQSDNGVREEVSFNRRAVEMMMAVNMFVDHPFIGVGGNNYPKLYPRYIRESGAPVPDEERTPHSFYLQIAAEHGIIGLLTWGGVLVLTFARLREARRRFLAVGDTRFAELASALTIGYVGYLCTAIFLHGAYPQFLWLQVGMAVALALLARRATNSAPIALPVPATQHH